jgi:hypothetical protein
MAIRKEEYKFPANNWMNALEISQAMRQGRSEVRQDFKIEIALDTIIIEGYFLITSVAGSRIELPTLGL